MTMQRMNLRHTPQLLTTMLLLAGPAAGLSQKVTTNSTPSASSLPSHRLTELATLGGGCFWCVEAIYQRIHGVKSVTSGYAGGKREKPTYEEVCTGQTGHAEVIQLEFDPNQVSYESILEVFWLAHDPTTLNRQGHDVGTQYRSVIFYHSPQQKETAEKSKRAAAAQFSSPIVTQIVPYTEFYKAEKYHQSYYKNNPGAPYCAAVIRPKLDKVLKKLSGPGPIKTQPGLD